MKRHGYRLRRITADWDFKNPFQLCFYFLRCLKLLVGRKSVKLIIKKSQSKGYHVFLWCRGAGKKRDLRKYIGDDVKHLNMDYLHRYGRQTLFSSKKKFVRGFKNAKNNNQRATK